MKSIPVICSGAKYNLGNAVANAFFAAAIADRTLAGDPFGVDIPEIRFKTEGTPAGLKKPLLVEGHSNLDDVVQRVDRSQFDHIEVRGLGMNIRHAQDNVRWLKFHLDGQDLPHYLIRDDEICIHIRQGDILQDPPVHLDYHVLPTNFYGLVLAYTGLRPVFIGQLDESWYTSALRGSFPNAKYLPSCSPLVSFETLRRARNKVISISSLAFYGAFLGGFESTVHMPISGFFNPLNRADIDLVPRNDERYRLYEFPAIRRGQIDHQGIHRFLSSHVNSLDIDRLLDKLIF